MSGLVTSAAIVSGELILGLSDGSLIRCGYVQGPQGLQGERGPMGATGRPGLDGNGLLHGAGVPQYDDGKDGDFYIDTKELKIYGPKSNGTWGSGVALRPEDRGSVTLPTGMKAAGGMSRMFSAGGGAGAGGGATIVTPPPTIPTPPSGWNPIIRNGGALTAGAPLTVAQDPTGLAFHTMLRGESATGVHYLEVVATRLAAGSAVVDQVIAWEIRMGTSAPTLTPTAVVNGGVLELQVNSDQALTSLTGAYQYL